MSTKFTPPSLIEYFISFIILNAIYIFLATFLEYVFNFQFTRALVRTVGGLGDLSIAYLIGYVFWCFIQSMFGLWVGDTYRQCREDAIEESEELEGVKKNKKSVWLESKLRSSAVFYYIKINIILVFSIPVHYFLILVASWGTRDSAF